MNPIFQSLATKQELDEFLMTLTEIEQKLFTLKTNAHQVIETELPYTLSQAFLSYAKSKQVTTLEQKSFHQLVTELTQEAHQLPIVSLRLSYMPPKAVIDGIVQWVRSHLSLSHLVDISVDPDLIGGAVIGYQGKYEDNSLRKTVEQYFDKLNAQHIQPKQQG